MKNAHTAFVGLGGNIGDSCAVLENALSAIAATDGVELAVRSGLYRSAPLGVTQQAEFVNAVCRVHTVLAPTVLLGALQQIETAAGRVRNGVRFGPRVLDLDLLLYDALQCTDATLTLPHPRMAQRKFVLAPLVEIAPRVHIPGHGFAADLLPSLAGQECVIIPANTARL